MLSGKLLAMGFDALHPYLAAEVGIVFNQARHYQETALIPEGVPIAPFANYSSSAFSHAAGAGVDWQLDEHLRLGLRVPICRFR